MGCFGSNLAKAVQKRFDEKDVVLITTGGLCCILHDPFDFIDGDIAVLSEDVIWLKSPFTKAFELPLKDVSSLRVFKRRHSEQVDVLYCIVELHYCHQNPDARMELLFVNEDSAKMWVKEIQKRIPGKGSEFDSVSTQWENLQVMERWTQSPD